jgi:hypothetical protein
MCSAFHPAGRTVYPLLKYEPAVLALTALVYGAKLVTGEWDEVLEGGLTGASMCTHVYWVLLYWA